MCAFMREFYIITVFVGFFLNFFPSYETHFKTCVRSNEQVSRPPDIRPRRVSGFCSSTPNEAGRLAVGFSLSSRVKCRPALVWLVAFLKELYFHRAALFFPLGLNILA